MARARGGKRIQELRWSLVTGRATALAPGSVAVNMLPAQTFGQTVMRTRGELLVWLDGAQAPGSLCRWAFGLVVVPEGQGTTVVWAPLTDPNAPWFAYQSGHLGYEEFVIDAV